MSTVRSKYGSMVHDFSGRELKHRSRSSFSMPSDNTLTLVPDLLIPIYRRYAYPGDTLKLSISALIRLFTQKFPFFTPLMMDVHVWSVPIRQVWTNWLKLQGQQDKPGDSTDYLVPIVNSGSTGFAVGSIYDYFWEVPNVANYDTTVLFERAYTHTWNTRYRDENLQDPIEFPTGDSDSADNYKLLPRGKRKDYITSALPFPQKGEDVLLPLGNFAPVTTSADHALLSPPADGLYWRNITDGSIPGDSRGLCVVNNSGRTTLGSQTANTTSGGVYPSNLIADLSQAQAATMSQLYVANAIQQMLQLDAQAGTRYDEAILARWGVKPTNYRISAYPEFLGGGTFDLNMQIIPQTSGTTSTSPQGTLASYGVINGSTKQIVKSFDEHCVVFAVASIRPGKYYYQFGVERDTLKRSRTDFYEPCLANLPEQGIFKSEVFVQPKTVLGSDGSTPDNQTIFGYQERWSEDKTSRSHICGYMRSGISGSLDFMHLAADYDASYATLNSDFIEENLTNALNRVIAIDESANTPPFYGQFSFDEVWIREMPVYNNPSFLMF